MNVKSNERISTKLRLEGNTEKLKLEFGKHHTSTTLNVSVDGEVKYTERTPLKGTRDLAALIKDFPRVGVEFVYNTYRTNSLHIAGIECKLDDMKSTPLRPTIELTSWYSTQEEHYKKIGKVKDELVKAGYLPQQGECQITMTVDC